MSDSNVSSLHSPATDLPNEVLKQGARELLARAIEAEVAELSTRHSHLMVDGKQAVVRDGYLPAWSVQTGLGYIEVNVSKSLIDPAKASSSTVF